ncbi:cytochrome P450 [Mycena leptocephala]|nr:cytochrome P450 [Mycena leptocephala]
MTFIDPSIALWATATLALTLYLLLPLPPGPRKLPLVGNLFDLPPTFEWEAYVEWSRKFGENKLIVLSSFVATEALLEKRSAIYSDRSHLPMLVDLMGWDWSLVGRLMRYGKNLQGFNIANSQTFRPKELEATHGLLRRLHIRQMAGELILSVTYGIEVLPVDDPYIALVEEAVQSASEATIPGKFLVDSIPMLKYVPHWVPGAGFKRKANEWRKLGQALLDVPFAEVKRQIALGTAPPSFTAQSLQILNESDEAYYEEATVKGTAGIMYVAGSDTTVAALTTFVLAMLANPEAQKKAQLEIDSVTSQRRLPDFGDEDSLPYVSALVKEVLRWRPVAPIGLQYLISRRLHIENSLRYPSFFACEDEYCGYRIPANSIVIGNVWAILHDEVMYPDPLTFKPERFLLNGKPNPDVRDPQAAFGFGRRICPGRHMAMSSVWITVASTLATFDITKAVGLDGQTIEPTYEYLSELVSRPAPFQCSIRPRSQDAVALIEATGI